MRRRAEDVLGAWLHMQLRAALTVAVCAIAALCSLMPGNSDAQNTAAVQNTANGTPISTAGLLAHGYLVLGRHTAHLEDHSRALGIEKVSAPEWSTRFAATAQETPNFGYSTAAHWLRFTLTPGATRADLLLEVGLPSLDSIQLFSPMTVAGQVSYAARSAGDQAPWHTRAIKHRNHLFTLQLEPGPSATYYLRVVSTSVVTVPLTLWTPEAFAAHERQAQLIYGLFYGVLIAMFLFNFALLIALRDSTYLLYTAYVGTLGMTLFTFDGFAFEHLWPNQVWWANQALATLLSASVVCGNLFARHFLSLSIQSPRADRMVQMIIAIAAFCAFCSATGWWLTYSQVLPAVSLLAIVSAPLSLIVALRGALGGYRPARFFLLAWAVLLVFVVVAALRNFALVPTNFVTLNGLHIGFVFDVLLLSFALGDRINLLRREKLSAQTALLEDAQRHERELEGRVERRTMEIEQANRTLLRDAVEREALVRRLSESETRMRHLAQHDALTGLPNRLSLQERFGLASEFAKRQEHKVAVLLLDLDRFKELNDARGHAAGDEALIALSTLLRTTVRGSDTVARLGGDEFVILASDLDTRDSVRPVIEKISDVVGIPVNAGGGAWTLSVSIGVAFYPDDAGTLDELLKLADAAMYADKAERKRRGVHQPAHQPEHQPEH